MRGPASQCLFFTIFSFCAHNYSLHGFSLCLIEPVSFFLFPFGGVVFFSSAVYVRLFQSFFRHSVLVSGSASRTVLGFIVNIFLLRVFNFVSAWTLALSSETVKKASRPFISADEAASAPHSLLFQ